MELSLVHALVLTPFERSLVTSLNWEEVAQCDFAIHALYCCNTRAILFLSDNQKSEPDEEISKIQFLFSQIGIPSKIEQQIIIMESDENEYSAEDVLKHFQ